MHRQDAVDAMCLNRRTFLYVATTQKHGDKAPNGAAMCEQISYWLNHQRTEIGTNVRALTNF